MKLIQIVYLIKPGGIGVDQGFKLLKAETIKPDLKSGAIQEEKGGLMR